LELNCYTTPPQESLVITGRDLKNRIVVCIHADPRIDMEEFIVKAFEQVDKVGGKIREVTLHGEGTHPNREFFSDSIIQSLVKVGVNRVKDDNSVPSPCAVFIPTTNGYRSSPEWGKFERAKKEHGELFKADGPHKCCLM